jgi:hypothetical protein
VAAGLAILNAVIEIVPGLQAGPGFPYLLGRASAAPLIALVLARLCRFVRLVKTRRGSVKLTFWILLVMCVLGAAT